MLFQRCVSIHEQRSQRILFSGGVHGVIKAWLMRTNECVATLRGHTGDIRTLELSPECLFSGSSDFTVRVWDRSTFVCVQVLLHGTTVTKGVSIGPNLITSGHDRVIRLWKPTVSPEAIHSGAVAPEGK